MKEYQRQDGVMYLYDGDEKHVLVFPLIPKKEEFYNYKKSELETIPEDERRLQAITDYDPYYPTSPYYEILNDATIIDGRRTRMRTIESTKLFSGSGFYGPFHKVIPFKIKLDSNTLIEKYYNKLGSSNYLEVTGNSIDDTEIKGLILGDDFYQSDDNVFHRKVKNDIINIPTTILGLEQFMDGCFEGLDEEQIKEYLKLYEQVDINNPFYVKELSDVDEMAKYFPQTVILRSTIEQGIKNDAKVLSLLKKRR